MKVKVVSGWGFRVLAAFLLLYGLIPLMHLSFGGNENNILAVLAIAAGVLIFLGI
jgi:hypothetical protein